MIKTIFISILFCFLGLFATGQSGFFAGNSVQVNLHAGKIVKNYPVFPGSGISSLIEFRWQYQTYKSWTSYYGYPTIGFGGFFGSFGNPDELGNVYGLMPQMTFTVRKNRKIPLILTLGWGYGYWTKKYDAVTNPNNMAIGANITNMACFSATIPIRLSANLQMNIGLSTTHFSNGHYRMPNNGINIPSFVVGLHFGNDTVISKIKTDKFNPQKMANSYSGRHRLTRFRRWQQTHWRTAIPRICFNGRINETNQPLR